MAADQPAVLADSTAFIKPTGKWSARGVDPGPGGPVTELVLLLVTPAGKVNGAVDDGDGVFDGSASDCQITGTFDVATGLLVFDQVYADDGAITTWRARYDAEVDSIVDGTWGGAAFGDFTAHRAEGAPTGKGPGDRLAAPRAQGIAAQNSAAANIRACYRGNHVRRRQSRQIEVEQNAAAISIQAAQRGKAARAELAGRSSAAIKIQAVYRGKVARNGWRQQQVLAMPARQKEHIGAEPNVSCPGVGPVDPDEVLPEDREEAHQLQLSLIRLRQRARQGRAAAAADLSTTEACVRSQEARPSTQGCATADDSPVMEQRQQQRLKRRRAQRRGGFACCGVGAQSPNERTNEPEHRAMAGRISSGIGRKDAYGVRHNMVGGDERPRGSDDKAAPAMRAAVEMETIRLRVAKAAELRAEAEAAALLAHRRLQTAEANAEREEHEQLLELQQRRKLRLEQQQQLQQMQQQCRPLEPRLHDLDENEDEDGHREPGTVAEWHRELDSELTYTARSDGERVAALLVGDETAMVSTSTRYRRVLQDERRRREPRQQRQIGHALRNPSPSPKEPPRHRSPYKRSSSPILLRVGSPGVFRQSAARPGPVATSRFGHGVRSSGFLV